MTELVIVAHADDESLGLSARLGVVAEDARVVFVTDGTVDPALDPSPYYDRYRFSDAYRLMRQKEALEALAVLGMPSATFLGEPCQRIGRGPTGIEGLRARIEAEIERVGPASIVTHDYEGGNIDHDIVSGLVHAAAPAGLPVLRFPLYHLAEGQHRHGEPVRDEIGVRYELPEHRARMIAAYTSQRHETRWFADQSHEWLLLDRLPDSSFLGAPPVEEIQYERRRPGSFDRVVRPTMEALFR